MPAVCLLVIASRVSMLSRMQEAWLAMNSATVWFMTQAIELHLPNKCMLEGG